MTRSAAWQAINNLTGRRTRPLTVVAADSVEHRKDLMKEHYSKVLNAPDTQAGAPLEPLGITICEEAEFSTDPISEDEVERAVKTMISDAAAGPDHAAEAAASGGRAGAGGAPPWRAGRRRASGL